MATISLRESRLCLSNKYKREKKVDELGKLSYDRQWETL